MAGQIVKGRVNQGIQVKIHSILLLYSKEGWIITIGVRLLKIELSHYQG